MLFLPFKHAGYLRAASAAASIDFVVCKRILEARSLPILDPGEYGVWPLLVIIRLFNMRLACSWDGSARGRSRWQQPNYVSVRGNGQWRDNGDDNLDGMLQNASVRYRVYSD